MNGDTSLMTPMQNKEEYIHRFDYSAKSKACIPHYNIKTIYNQNVSPFFSPTGKELDNLVYLNQSVNIEPEEKEVQKNGSKANLNSKKKQAETPNPTTGKKKKGEQSPEKGQVSIMSDYRDESPELNNHQSESQIHIDPEMMKKTQETALLLD